MNYVKELQIAKQAAVSAGHVIMNIYEDKSTELDILYKEDQSPLTKADRCANEMIVKQLRESFPGYAILSEEEKDNLERLQHDLCFVVDPLDGTKEFIKRNGQFTVNIALAFQGNVVMGVIYVPVTGELYYASKGQGAYLVQTCDQMSYNHSFNNQKVPGSEPVRLHVSNRKQDIRVVMSLSHNSSEMEEMAQRNGWTNMISMGSSLKGCLIAKGDAEVYYRHNPTMEWDTAAMQCIVEEAGGIFRQTDGSRMTYNRKDSVNRKGFYVLNCMENQAR